jgi:cupin fold WbuC family metalloprotein
LEKIYSRTSPGKLLHMVVRKADFNPGRQNLVPDEQFIQCSMMEMAQGTTFQPHRHIWKERAQNVIAQESWMVVQGSVKAIFYDLDDELLDEVVLSQGDASFTLEGGHNYLILEDGTMVYEYKTGPYEGQDNDKRFLERADE